MDIDEIKKLLAAGDVAGAEAAAKAALENDPDNVRLLIVFGTCRQLQGDEEAFLGTYELVRAALDEKKIELDATAAEEWKRFEALHERIAQPELLRKDDPPRAANLMEYVLLAVLIAAATGVAIWYFGRATCSLYAGPPRTIAIIGDLYAGPPEPKRVKEIGVIGAKDKIMTKRELGDLSDCN